VTVKTFALLPNKCRSFNSIHHEEKKSITVSKIILSSTTVFNIDNEKKCAFSSKSLKGHVTLKTGVMMLKNKLYHHRSNKSIQDNYQKSD